MLLISSITVYDKTENINFHMCRHRHPEWLSDGLLSLKGSIEVTELANKVL